MTTNEPPSGFCCGALGTDDTCFYDGAACHFPSDVQACFRQKECSQVTTEPHEIDDDSPPLEPELDPPPRSILASREMLRGMMHHKPPET